MKLIPEVHPSMQYGNDEYVVFVHAVYDAMLANLMRPVPFWNIGAGMAIQRRISSNIFNA